MARPTKAQQAAKAAEAQGDEQATATATPAKTKMTVHGVGEKYIPTDGPFAGYEFHSKETYALALTSNYAEYRVRAYAPDRILGGVPADPETMAGWLRTKMKLGDADLALRLREAILASGLYPDIPEGLSVKETIEFVHVDTLEKLGNVTADMAELKNLSKFRRNPRTGNIYIEGRQLKAGFKEAANTAFAADRWGATRKGTRAYLAERVFVVESEVFLAKALPGYVNSIDPTKPAGMDPNAPLVYLTAADGKQEGIVHVPDGMGGTRSAFSVKEYVEGAVLQYTFRVHNDVLDIGQWMEILELSQDQGVGAARSQSFGKFEVLTFERIAKNAKRRIVFIDHTVGKVAAPVLEDPDDTAEAGVNYEDPGEAVGVNRRSKVMAGATV